MLFFLYLNIIFNLSHPLNHSQTLTKCTLNPPSYTLNPLKVNITNFTLWSISIHHPPLPPINLHWERGEERWRFLYF